METRYTVTGVRNNYSTVIPKISAHLVSSLKFRIWLKIERCKSSWPFDLNFSTWAIFGLRTFCESDKNEIKSYQATKTFFDGLPLERPDG